MKKIFTSFILSFFLLCGVAFAEGIQDLYSYTYWKNKSGYSSGTINDIIYKYLGSLGYAGTINDRLHGWLADLTGESGSINDLAQACFYSGGPCYTSGALTFNSATLTFNSATLTFNP